MMPLIFISNKQVLFSILFVLFSHKDASSPVPIN
jgi:hypothetical protein